MTGSMKLASLLATALAAVALQACSDNTAELASPGNPGSPPGFPPAPPPPPPPPPPAPPPPASACPTGTSEVTVGTATHCRLTGILNNDVRLTAGVPYQLFGVVQVGVDTGGAGTTAGGDPATLTIEPGVTVYAATPQSALFVNRGSRLVASGSQAQPIIFTSAQDAGFAAALGLTNQRAPFTGPFNQDPNTLEWGGLVINGQAPINTCNGVFGAGTNFCETEGEGGSGLYGGADAADDSGVLRFVQVRYAGQIITATNELNGIAFQGVGNGTLVEFVQVHNGGDDGLEFFGGTVNGRYLVVTGADDDSIDWTFGYSGRLQYALVLQNPLQGTDGGIEADSQGSAPFTNNNAVPRATPFLSNVTLVGATTGGIGILLRAGTAGRILNTTVTGFPGGGLDIDSTASIAEFNAGRLRLDSFYNANALALVNETDLTPAAITAQLATFSNNSVGNSTLNGFINGGSEQAVPATNPVPVDPFFQTTTFIGAVNSDAAFNAAAPANSNWTQGWTFAVNPAPVCPSNLLVESGGAVCVLTGTITQNTRLVQASNLTYRLRGPVFVGQDAGGDVAAPIAGTARVALTIDAGVRVEAESLTSGLFVSRGSQLFANGTRAEPVVFTRQANTPINVNSSTTLWGGIAVNGRAPLNTCNGVFPAGTNFCETDGEGGSGLYGGNSATDNSGNLVFTRVEFAGNPITSTNELNGIAFQGTGNGTNVANLQVHNGGDDGIEFFGGTVNVRNLVITGADDDSIDWTFGYSGRIQNAVVVQNPLQGTDGGIEADSQGSAPFLNNDALPRATPLLSNVTLVGATTGGIGILLRAGTAGRILNTTVTGFPGGGLDIDSTASIAEFNAGRLRLDSFYNANALALVNDTDLTPAAITAQLATFSNNSAGASTLAVAMGATASLGRVYVNGANENAVPVTNPASVDPFFTNPTNIGAVPSQGGANFTTGWTIWLND